MTFSTGAAAATGDRPTPVGVEIGEPLVIERDAPVADAASEPETQASPIPRERLEATPATAGTEQPSGPSRTPALLLVLGALLLGLPRRRP